MGSLCLSLLFIAKCNTSHGSDKQNKCALSGIYNDTDITACWNVRMCGYFEVTCNQIIAAWPCPHVQSGTHTHTHTYVNPPGFLLSLKLECTFKKASSLVIQGWAGLSCGSSATIDKRTWSRKSSCQKQQLCAPSLCSSLFEIEHSTKNHSDLSRCYINVQAFWFGSSNWRWWREDWTGSIGSANKPVCFVKCFAEKDIKKSNSKNSKVF